MSKFFIAVLASLTLTACYYWEDSGEKLTLAADTEQAQVVYADETKAPTQVAFTAPDAWMADVNSSDAATRAGSNVDWLRLLVDGKETYTGPAGDHVFTVETDENTTGVARSAVFTITSAGQTVDINIRQEAITVQEAIDEGTYEAPAAKEHSVTVTDGTASVELATTGVEITLTAVEKDGFIFMGWEAVQPTDLEITDSMFVMPSMPVIVEAQFEAEPENVLINGVKWALRNVDAPNTFTAAVEDFGMHYQFGWNVGWGATKATATVSSPASAVWQTEEMFFHDPTDTNDDNPEAHYWEENTPCPAGYAMPSEDDLRSLLDTEKVAFVFVEQNGVEGAIFTDIASGAELFLPGASYHTRDTGIGNSTNGFYLADGGEQFEGRSPMLNFYDGKARMDGQPVVRDRAHSIRCVYQHGVYEAEE